VAAVEDRLLAFDNYVTRLAKKNKRVMRDHSCFGKQRSDWFRLRLNLLEQRCCFDIAYINCFQHF